MDDDFIVKKVDYNFLIDYLKISFNNNLSFKESEINLYKKKFSNCDDYSEEVRRNDFMVKVCEDEFLKCLLFEVLHVDIDTMSFWNGSSNYKFGVSFNDMYFLSFDGPINRYNAQTNLLELKGQGCRYFESLEGKWKNLLSRFVDFHTFLVTRLDLAFDDFTNRFEVNFLFDKMKKDEWTSNARTYRYQISGTKEVLLGETLEVGTISSNKLLCIYNKKLEREAKDYEVDTTFWTRYELRLSGDIAKSAFYELNENFNLSEYVPKVILGFLQFKESVNFGLRNLYKNNDYLPWIEFLQNASKHKIVNQFKLEETLTRKKDWVERSTFKALMFTSYLEGENFAKFLSQGIINKYNEITVKELKIINDYNKEKGLKELNLDEAKEMAKNFILKE